MQFSWWTFALQVVNFLVLVWLLQRFLYRPVRNILEKREKLRMAAFTEADKAKKEADAARQSYQEARAALAKERQEMLDAAQRSVEAERAKRLEEARQEAARLIEAAHVSIAEERAKTLTGLEADIANLAVRLAGKLLDKVGGALKSEVFLDQIETALKTMSDADRRRLLRDLAANGAHVTVVTATPLKSQEQKAWQARLEGNLDRHLEIAFDVDPKLIAGAAVHFPHMVVSFAWADQLKEAKQVLLSGNHEKPS